MLRQLGSALPGLSGVLAARGPVAPFFLLSNGFRAVADVEIALHDREVLKKYVGVRDHLSKEPGTRGKLVEALTEVLEALRAAPATSEYRKAVEASCHYRMKVCQENEADSAVEDVLDAHLEELIKEAKEEARLVPMIVGEFRASSSDIPRNEAM
jgi:NADH dehydrogenase (ubiquinone) 1 alpha subcomplex subunit 5